MWKRSTMLVLVLAAMAGLGGVLFSQASDSIEAKDSVYTLSVFQDLELVNLVVTDKNGNAIRNLRRENFTFFEDKAPQTVSTFGFEDLTITFE